MLAPYRAATSGRGAVWRRAPTALFKRLILSIIPPDTPPIGRGAAAVGHGYSV